jgi:hypothetical protein
VNRAAGFADPLAETARRIDAKERPPGSTAAELVTKTRVAHSSFNRGISHPDHMADAGPAPARELSFSDFLDIINPLQHIPIIGTIYRAITGDEISPSARIFGGFLFGGPLGFVAAAANVIADEASGQDLGETALAALIGDDTVPDVQTAQATSASANDAPLEAAALTQIPQDQAAATATGPTARTAGTNSADSESGPSANLTGREALDAFVRDLRDTGQLARMAPPSGDLGHTETGSEPLPPLNPGRPQIAERQTLVAAPEVTQRQNPDLAIRNRPEPAVTKAGAATQTLRPSPPSWSRPANKAQPENPGALIAIQARAPDAVLADARTDARAAGLASPGTAFAARMLHALDKYQAIAREGEKDGADRTPRLDTRL